jgi:hypothetical protein
MTRNREPIRISDLRRRAKAIDDGTPMGARLDAVAHAEGYGNWSCVLKGADVSAKRTAAAETETSIWPFGGNQAVSPKEGGVVARLTDGTPVRLKHGHSLNCFLDGIDPRESTAIASSLLRTDPQATFVVHGNGDLRRMTSRVRSTMGTALIAGDEGRHGCGIEPLSGPWLTKDPRHVPNHVRAVVECLCGNEGPDAESHHDVLETALRMVSQSSDVRLADVLRQTRMRRGSKPWSEKDTSICSSGRPLVPADMRGPKPMTVYVDRNGDPWSRRDRVARTIQTAISRRWLGDEYDPEQIPLTVVYDGPATWEDQPMLLVTPDLGRSRLVAQILCGGDAADFERIQGGVNTAILRSVTRTRIETERTDEGMIRMMRVLGSFAEAVVRSPDHEAGRSDGEAA